MPADEPLSLSENHRRSIATALALVDEMLCEFEQYARGREERSAMYEERNDLSPAQREAIAAEAARMKAVVREARDTLRLEPTVREAARRVWAASCAFRETLEETKSRYLKRYGRTPPELGRYLDPLIESLIDGLTGIARAASGQDAATAPRRKERRGDAEGRDAETGRRDAGRR